MLTLLGALVVHHARPSLLFGIFLLGLANNTLALGGEETTAASPSQSEVALRIDDVQVLLIQDVQVPVRIAGQIESVDASEGMQVATGQILAKLDTSETIQAIRRAELEVQLSELIRDDTSAIDLARQRVEMTSLRQSRFEQLRERSPGSISKDRMEDARFARQEATAELRASQAERDQATLSSQIQKAALELQKLKLQYHTISSPIDGVVAEVHTQTGQWVGEGESVARVVGLRQLRVEAFVNAESVDEDWLGRSARFRLASSQTSKRSAESNEAKRETDATRTFSGKVVFVSPLVQSVTSQVRVWVQLDNPNGELRPGSRGQLEIVGAE